jgi:ATP-dependent Lhr-like helicase
MFSYVANFLYEGDSPLAERRAQALTVNPADLRQLLGEVELRDLLAPDVIDDVERSLQHLTPERAAHSADGLHDLLLQVGDLSEAEISERAWPQGAAPGWIAALAESRRIVALTVGGERRWAAVEDIGRYRDALGTPPPPGLAQAFLEPVRDPLGDLVSRYARTHGPFLAEDVAARFGIGTAPVRAALGMLARLGRVIEGEFRPGRSGREWCEQGVLRAIRQRSLARLRREVEPAEPAALGRLLLDWQGIGLSRRGPQALLDVIAQLQGLAIPASALEAEVLPARLPRYDGFDLDRLMASGAVIWTGAGSLGPRDGRVRLYLAEHAPLLVEPVSERPTGPLHQRIRAFLAERGASFFPQILRGTAQAGTPGFVPDVLAALWDLVWAGEVMNDTLEPLRAMVGLRDGRKRPPRRREGALRRQLGLGPGMPLGARGLPAEASGRWSLVSSLLGEPPSRAEALTARARQLLERHGVLTREAVVGEGIEGGFATIYGVLKAMEEAGRIRRGYFVAGRGATQFALPGALDRLRGLREPAEEIRAVPLAAIDPANPYGAALPWPEREPGRRPSRVAGAMVILVDGALAAWMGPRERRVLTFPEGLEHRAPVDVNREVARALAREALESGHPLVIDEVDGLRPGESHLAAALREAGFAATPSGYVCRPSPS